MSARPRHGLAATLATVLLVASCGRPDAPGPAEREPAPEPLPTGGLRVAPGEIVWAAGRRLQVGERSHRAPARVRELAVGPHGVYYVAGGRLRFTDLERDEDVSEFDGFDDLVQSHDGRYLGFVDHTTLPASAVAYDLQTGAEVARSDAGMGDPDEDLADLYEDGEPRFLGFDEAAGYVKGADQSVYRLPLDGSEVEELHEHGSGPPLPVLPPPRHGTVDSRGDETSPDGSVVLEETYDGRWRPVDARTGRPTGTDLGDGRTRFLVGGWLDGHTVYGAAGHGRGVTLGKEASIVVCDLQAFRCHDVWGPVRTDSDGLVLFPGRHHLF